MNSPFLVHASIDSALLSKEHVASNYMLVCRASQKDMVVSYQSDSLSVTLFIPQKVWMRLSSILQRSYTFSREEAIVAAYLRYHRDILPRVEMWSPNSILYAYLAEKFFLQAEVLSSPLCCRLPYGTAFPGDVLFGAVGNPLTVIEKYSRLIFFVPSTETSSTLLETLAARVELLKTAVVVILSLFELEDTLYTVYHTTSYKHALVGLLWSADSHEHVQIEDVMSHKDVHMTIWSQDSTLPLSELDHFLNEHNKRKY